MLIYMKLHKYVMKIIQVIIIKHYLILTTFIIGANLYALCSDAWKNAFMRELQVPENAEKYFRNYIFLLRNNGLF